MEGKGNCLGNKSLITKGVFCICWVFLHFRNVPYATLEKSIE